MTESAHIVIAEPADAIRRGIRAILTEADLPCEITTAEVSLPDRLRDISAARRPDILVISPAMAAHISLSRLKKEHPGLLCVLLRTSLADTTLPTYIYDEVISLYDTADEIRGRIASLLHDPDRRHADSHEPLSRREKEIVVGVVKGLTNRRIADRLHLSHHTVNTHRRNISAKLDIHTTSGLTIYAISNNLITLDELAAGDSPSADS